MSFENTGLRVAEVAGVARLMAQYEGMPEELPNVLRLAVNGPNWSTLHREGIVVRPTWIHWTSPATSGSSGVLARQSTKQRQLCRPAMRALAAMKTEVSEPVDRHLYDEWLAVYSARVGELRHGRNLARLLRGSVLAPSSQHGLVVWRKEDRLVCGCVYSIDPQRSVLAGRFGAVAAEGKAVELSRGMYMVLADMAAERGLRWVTLGNDVNFFGSVVNPGLCTYKMRLGFRPVPADMFGVADCRDVAERVTSLAGLELPVLRFEYRRQRRPQETIEDFVGGPSALGLVSVTSPGFANGITASLPQHRQLFLD